jgi:hypothetical protein
MGQIKELIPIDVAGVGQHNMKNKCCEDTGPQKIRRRQDSKIAVRKAS